MARSRRKLLWTLACSVTVPLVFACNGIVGISDYTRGECSGGGICGDGGLPDTVVGDGSSDAPQPKVDASGTQPVSWAQWPMPNYDAGTPTDNAPMGYDAVANGLQDKITKLVWRHPMPAGSDRASYAKARDLCSGEWRLPSRIELVTLLDLGQPTGAKIDPAFKADSATVQGVYWTFSEVRSAFGEYGADGVRDHWVVDFGGGGLDKRDENGEEAAVRCVKGGS